MLKLNIQNFRIIKSLDITDEGKLSIFVGYNESGKSSIAGAIKFAYCGEAFGHKGKNIGTLVTHGESRMAVRVQVNDSLVYRTSYDTGDSLVEIAKNLKVPKEVVPLLFDSEMAGDGGNKAMRAYLTGVAEDQFDPSVHFAKEEVIKECADQAKRAGKLPVKAIIAYCEEQRAMKKAPSKPVMPQGARPTAADLATVASDLVALATRLATTKADMESAQAISGDLSRVANYVKALADYQAKVDAAPAGDPLGTQRQGLERLSGINTKTLDSMADLLTATGYERDVAPLRAVQARIVEIVAIAQKTLADCPAPASAPVRPIEPERFSEYVASLTAEGKPLQERLSEVLAQAAQAVLASTSRYQAVQAAKTTAQNLNDSLQRAAGAWSSYDAAALDYEANAQRAEVEWAKWNRAAKEISEAHTAFLSQQSQRFSNIITDMGTAVLGGRKLAIDITNGITLGGLPIEEVSKSTRWRMEVSVMTAVARSLNSPLLIIDGADILDCRNRVTMTSFLMEHVVPYFKHVILLMTAKDEISKETPLAGEASRWIINEGTVYKL